MDLTALAAVLPGAPQAVELHLDQDLERSEVGRRLSELLHSLQRRSDGGLRLVRDRGNNRQPAGVTVNGQGIGTIRYCTVPEGPEAQPFAELLLLLAQAKGAPQPPTLRPLQQLTKPAELLVFVAAACPHCPAAVRNALALAIASPLVTITVVDAAAHADLAGKHRVRSVPMTVIDGELLIAGVTQAQRLAELLLQRGTDHHEQETLAGLLAVGGLAEVGERLRSSRQAQTAFARLWAESTLETRMALTLAAELALEAAPDGLDDLVHDLVPSLSSEVVALRGDTVDLLASIAHPGAGEAVAALLNDVDPDVAEAAGEALARMQQRQV